MSPRAVRVLRLGAVPYAEALRVQERCVAAARAARGGAGQPLPAAAESVVLSEPAQPVYTWGLRGAPGAAAAAALRARGAALVAARRGGHITFHGPGQLLAFPVLDLRRRRLPLRAYVAGLEALVLRLCRRLGLGTARALPPPYTGVWMGDSKLCAIVLSVGFPWQKGAQRGEGGCFQWPGQRGHCGDGADGTCSGPRRCALREPHHLARAGAQLLHRPLVVRAHRALRPGGHGRHLAQPRAGTARRRQPRPRALPRLLPGGVRVHFGLLGGRRGLGSLCCLGRVFWCQGSPGSLL
ncbi:putative lipoyltransferase 2, mitochondrial isoform X1 [Camarhynchus parvulus]|uniref:putative lipoyltransferase 2, mitochondrial isoform X1 n=1 Tax=Geospiza parvula TaxID=87175 RepID=UPI001237AF50|nr:putative lipoyltransferase 2, mitochondrial isoform X1 [Camarhynchus parvulus]